MRFIFLLLLCAACASGAKSNTRMSMIHTQIGTRHLADGNYSQAFRDLSTAVQLDAKNPVAHNNLAIAYMVRKKWKEAEQHYKTALELHPKYTDAKVNYANLQIENKNYSAAIQLLNDAKLDLAYQESHKLYHSMGLAYFQMADYKNASENFRESILSERRFCPAHRWFGASLFLTEEIDRAIKAIEHALSLCTKERYPELFYYGGLSYYKVGKMELAKGKLKELLDLPGDSYKKEGQELLQLIESM